mgnify:CR=1 FL=1
MAAYTLSATPQVVGVAGVRQTFTNTGAVNAFLSWLDGGTTRTEVIPVGAGPIDFTPTGVPSARTDRSSGALTVTTTAASTGGSSTKLRGGTA